MKKFLPILILLVVFFAGCIENQEDEVARREAEKNIENATALFPNDPIHFVKAFQEKYPRFDVVNNKIVIEKISGYLAMGMVENNEVTAGWWIAFKENGTWKIVADGNGDVKCQTVEMYAVPVDWVPNCYDEGTGEMIKREKYSYSPIVSDILDALESENGRVSPDLEYQVNLEKVNDEYITGKLKQVNSEGEWKNFLGYYDEGEIKIADFDFKTPTCEVAEKYEFPIDFVPRCWDVPNAEMVERERKINTENLPEGAILEEGLPEDLPEGTTIIEE